MGEGEQPVGERIGDLTVVEEDFDLAGLEVVLEGGGVACARLGIVHDGKLKVAVAHGEAQRRGHVAEHRLRRGDRSAGELRADRGGLVGDGLERRFDRGEAGLKVGLVRRIAMRAAEPIRGISKPLLPD